MPSIATGPCTVDGRPLVASHAQQYACLYSEYEDEAVRDFKATREVRRRVDYYTDPNIVARAIGGDERLAILRRNLASGILGYKRSKNQIEFHDAMIKACAKRIYGREIVGREEQVMRENGWSDLGQQVMIVTPRRWGKTTSVALFAVAIMLAVPGIEQAIFSTGKRASQKLLDLCYKMLSNVPGMQDAVIRHNSETIWIQGPGGNNDIRKIYSYPSKVKVCFYHVFLFIVVDSLDSRAHCIAASLHVHPIQSHKHITLLNNPRLCGGCTWHRQLGRSSTSTQPQWPSPQRSTHPTRSMGPRWECCTRTAFGLAERQGQGRGQSRL